MPIKVIENFLNEDVYEDCISTAEYLTTLSTSNVFFTNYSWGMPIRKDSYPVLIHDIDQESQLYKNIKSKITKSPYLKQKLKEKFVKKI